MSSIDSRSAALRIYNKLNLGWIFNTSTFFGNLLLSLLITYFFRKLGYGNAVDYVFLITILSIGLWITEAVPPFAVGIFIVCMMLFGFGTDFILDESTPVEIYTGTWTSNVIWLLLGGFFLAEAMKEVELDTQLFSFTMNRFGNQPEKLLLGLFFVTALGSMIMSNTAMTAMMISSITPLIRILGTKSNFSKALLIGIPSAATIGGIGTIIGSTPNAIAVGALQEKGININFLEWMLIGFPAAMILLYSFYLVLIYKLDIKGSEIHIPDLQKSNKKIDKFKKYTVLFVLVLTIVLWATEPIHGIPVAATSAVPILFLTMTQVITSEQVRSLPWDTLMLVAGGLALGIAIVDVGLSNIIMEKVNNLPLGSMIIALIFCFLGVMISNVMSNTAATSILIPLAISLPLPYGIATPIMVAISCSCALLLPVSTPSNAIAYATGLIEQKEFRLGGLFFIVTGPIVAFISSMIWVWIVQ
ncbi:MAG: DASS family sodium-coupled anion symporter [Leptospira sp.]|nr:DASS family sodium-coupled anion symporter [Leptospira sp.]NCS92761.1 DASS family sodium-coupled anion symporter [Leptospira sp.]